MLNNEAQAATAVALSPSNARTATVTGSWIDARAYVGDIIITQDVGTVSGTTPTLDGKIQSASDSGGTGAADLTGATFTQVTASTNNQKITISANAVQGWIRYVGTIAGTTPSFNVSVVAAGRTQVV